MNLKLLMRRTDQKLFIVNAVTSKKFIKEKSDIITLWL
jgi:hypothetical protein